MEKALLIWIVMEKAVRLQGYGKGSFDLDYKGKAVLLQGYGKGSFDLDFKGKAVLLQGY